MFFLYYLKHFCKEKLTAVGADGHKPAVTSCARLSWYPWGGASSLRGEGNGVMGWGDCESGTGQRGCCNQDEK